MTIRRRPGRHKKQRDLLKDRLIQTRVPEGLESALKDEAHRRRLSVSHLIRNVLEDTFHLVDNVVSEVDNLVHDSVGLARQVGRDAGRIAEGARKAGRPPESEPPPHRNEDRAAKANARTRRPNPALADVYAWDAVVMNRAGACAQCGGELVRGANAHVGLGATPGAAPLFLCAACVDRLSSR
jgi:hypothetical protein